MRRLPPLAELRAFEAAARHLSFKAAAAELGVTPTAVSHQIRLLEQFCGKALFRRRPRPLALAPAGARLFPAIRDGLDGFALALAGIAAAPAPAQLRITTTNAFASCWLVPRLPGWREVHPEVRLEFVGTDRVLDLVAGEADMAIRCQDAPPAGLASCELFRGRFTAVCRPALLPGGRPIRRLAALRDHTLIHFYWPEDDPRFPTWRRLLDSARARDPTVPRLSEADLLTFREELHAIEAARAGQGIAILDDAVVGDDLASGALVPALDLPPELAMPDTGYYLVTAPARRDDRLIGAFADWLRNLR